MFKNNLKDRKYYIAKKAGKIFVKNGYMSTSLQDIANAVGLSKSAIYHYFRTKDQILYYIIERETEEILKTLESCTEDSETNKLTPEDALREFIIAYASFLKKENVLPLILLRERHQLKRKYKKMLRKIEQSIFLRVKKEVMKVDSIKKNYDHNVISFLIISMSHWMGYWINEKRELSLQEAINQNINIIFYGMLKK